MYILTLFIVKSSKWVLYITSLIAVILLVIISNGREHYLPICRTNECLENRCIKYNMHRYVLNVSNRLLPLHIMSW